MHSAYATDAFEVGLFAAGERERVQALIGAEAERLVFLFCALDRRELFSAIAAEPEATGALLRLADRRDGAPLVVEPREVAELLVLHAANAADQSAAADGSPAPWLARTSQLLAWAHARGAAAMPVFDGAQAIVAREDEERLIHAYAAAVREASDVQLTALARAADDVPWVGEPFVWMALVAFAAGNVDAAASYARHGEHALRAWNAAWDKRLSHADWLALAALPQRNGDSERRAFIGSRLGEIFAVARSPVDVFARLDAAGAFDDPPDLPPRFAAYVEQLAAGDGPEAVRRYPGLSARPWYDPAQFPIVRELESAAKQIAAEYHALGDSDFHRESEDDVGRTGSWDVAILFERGRRRDELAARAPVTLGILERHRTVRGLAGLAYFSRLAPGTHIAPHAGPTTLRVRCHLGIDVPANCGLRVGGSSRTWEPGRCIVFDDAFEHEAWNDGDRTRAVLIVDLWHPDLTDEEIALIAGLHRTIERQAAGLSRYWAQNEAARAARS